MRTIAVVTVGRSDYGIYRPILRRLKAESSLNLRLIAGGAHFRPEFGLTIREVEADGFAAVERADVPATGEGPEGVARAIGEGVKAFAAVYASRRPDLLVVLGDRFEMYAAAVAALPFAIPLAHIHGGELTEGAMDDALRHSITKLSHLHFASTEEYAQRIRQLGEESWRVTVSGAPGLDDLAAVRLLDQRELAARFGLPFEPAPLLVTFHPVTLEVERTAEHVRELLKALADAGRAVVFTRPNADAGSQQIVEAVGAYVAAHRNAVLVDNAGTAYFSLMAACAAMVGNSSSGIIEAASFGLPVVNVGSRQRGRVRARNVIDVEPSGGEILAGLRRALDPAFRGGLRGLKNPYATGRASELIVERLKSVALDSRLTQKRFVDLPHG